MYQEKEIISKWNTEMYELEETGTEDIALLLSLLGKEACKVLEVACGTGRLLVPMAKAGHKVTGVDFDENMLKKISAKADGLTNICWKKADAVCDVWGTGYDAVVLAGNILFNIVADMGYSKAQEILIRKAADALLPGGHIFIDYGYTLHPERWWGENTGSRIIWQGTDSTGISGKMVLRDEHYNRETRMLRGVRCFELMLSDGSKLTEEIPYEKHFASIEQIHKWLETAGCVVEKEYGDYNGNPISDRTSRAVIWAKKM